MFLLDSPWPAPSSFPGYFECLVRGGGVRLRKDKGYTGRPAGRGGQSRRRSSQNCDQKARRLPLRVPVRDHDCVSGPRLGRRARLRAFAGTSGRWRSASRKAPRLFAIPIIAFLIITFLHVVFGELAAKSVAIARPEGTSLFVAPFMRAFYYLFLPGIYVFNGTANAFVRLFGIPPISETEETHTEGELRMLISTSTRQGGSGHGRGAHAGQYIRP